MNIGICGLGTVGSSLVKLLQSSSSTLDRLTPRPVRVVAVSARSRNKDRGVDLTSYQFYEDPLALLDDDRVDTVIELIGGTDAAHKLISGALERKKTVITANKAVISTYAAELHEASLRTQTSIFYEAAVGGGIPVINALRHGVQINGFDKIEAILNASTNFILQTMQEENTPFEAALRKAQHLGIAEADPSLDISGQDSLMKIRILYTLCYGKLPPDASTEGIDNNTLSKMTASGEIGEVRLVARATSERIVVQPEVLKEGSLLANLKGAMNAIVLHGKDSGPLLLQRLGAGGTATATAVMSDIVSAANQPQSVPLFGWKDLAH